MEIKLLTSQKRLDGNKIKDLEEEVRRLRTKELKMAKYKSEKPNHRRSDLSDDSDKEEESESQSPA